MHGRESRLANVNSVLDMFNEPDVRSSQIAVRQVPPNDSGLQDAAAFERRLARFGVGLAHFAEEVQVCRHYDSGAEMGCRREMNFVGEVIGEETHGDLALAVRVLVNRSGDDAFLKVRRHFGEKVRRD